MPRNGIGSGAASFEKIVINFRNLMKYIKILNWQAPTKNRKSKSAHVEKKRPTLDCFSLLLFCPSNLKIVYLNYDINKLREKIKYENNKRTKTKTTTTSSNKNKQMNEEEKIVKTVFCINFNCLLY